MELTEKVYVVFPIILCSMILELPTITKLDIYIFSLVAVLCSGSDRVNLSTNGKG